MTKITEAQKALLDELLKDYDGNPNSLLGDDGLANKLIGHLMERALEGEMDDHLGYQKHDSSGRGSGNSRNGKSKKTVVGKRGPMEIEVPRDRDSSFEPQLVKKRQTRIDGLDEKIISLYARGMSTREIQAELKSLYGADISAQLVSNVTAAVIETVREWQSRPLDSVYPIIFFDCLHAKTRENGPVENRAIYIALGINMDGEKEALGLWIAQSEGAKFWLSVFNELKNRGMEDCFIACMDGLKGLPEAVETVYPEARVQLCIVHQVRNSLKYVSWKNRKEVAKDLRQIYTAASVELAEQALRDFKDKWHDQYPAIAPSWEANWERLTPFFDYPPEIRRVIYTTNAIESLNHSLRKTLKGRRAFPNDESLLKLLYLSLEKAAEKWTMPIRNWKGALNQFIVMYGDRVPT